MKIPFGHLPQLDWFNAAFPQDLLCSHLSRICYKEPFLGIVSAEMVKKTICSFVSDGWIYSVGPNPRIHDESLFLKNGRFFWRSSIFCELGVWSTPGSTMRTCCSSAPLPHLRADLTELEDVTCVCSHCAHWGGCLLRNRSVLMSLLGYYARITCSGFADVSVFLLLCVFSMTHPQHRIIISDRVSLTESDVFTLPSV